MSLASEGAAHAPRDLAACDPEARALELHIAEASADQVALAGNRPLAIQVVQASGGELELASPSFLPRGAAVVLEPPGRGGGPGAIEALVRKVAMVDASPRYSVRVVCTGVAGRALEWDRVEPAAPCEARAGDPGGAFATASIPAWAARLLADGKLERELLLSAAKVASRAEGEADAALATALIGDGLVLEEDVAAAMALQLAVPFVDVHAFAIPATNRSMVPDELMRRHRLFPLFLIDGTITLAMRDPLDLAVIDQVRLRTGCHVDQCQVAPSVLESLIERAHLDADTELAPPELEVEVEDDANSSNATVRLVNALVLESAQEGVSDVHIEPDRDKLRVRIRLDGILHERSTHPLHLHASIVSRIKILAKLDIAETRRPQDGNFSLRGAAGPIDVRVSTIPTVHGENVVLRLFVSTGRAADLGELGMDPDTLERFTSHLDEPNGMLLVTGPTGSGKTTTLYAALQRLSTPERNVVTVEDPVEKRVPLLRQTEVNVKAGLTFATGLRSLLRQDPDVIMVGEIRDAETAEIAVQAALTGHLVLSTLHTNSAADAIVRLSEIGIPSFLVTSSLRAVMSQRLVRRVCASCSEADEVEPGLARALGFEVEVGVRLATGRGCPRCLHTGYRGRVGLYELLVLTSGLAGALLGEDRDEIEQEARAALVSSLREDGLRRVRDGLTTLQEVARVAGSARRAALRDRGGEAA